MNPTLPQLQSLLLDLISPRREVDPARVDALATEDWASLLGMSREHRLGSMLHWRLSRERAGLPVPLLVREECAKSFKALTLRALMLQRELLRIHLILEKAGIPHVALKGAYLAFHAYPQPALRPLRDLDILVPEDQALTAYQTLMDEGLARMDRYPGNPEVHLRTSKHLPPLRSPSGQVTVELHTRLLDHRAGVEGSDPSDSPEFWQRCISAPIANHAIPFESPTDLLLHLIIHAVYDHQFNNGPLLLSDLAYLFDTQAIDWPLFWDLAARGGQTRGCLLALKLTERYWGTQPIVWPAGSETDAMAEQLNAAALLMLRDFSATRDVSLGNEVARQATLAAKASVLLGKAFPPKAVIATTYPVPEHSLRVYLWYPAHLWRLTTQRLPTFLRSRQQTHLRHEARQLADLNAWLQEAPRIS